MSLFNKKKTEKKKTSPQESATGIPRLPQLLPAPWVDVFSPCNCAFLGDVHWKNRGEQRQWAANAGEKITLTTVNYRMPMGKTTSYFWCSMSCLCNKGFPKRSKNEPEVISVKVLCFKIGGNFKIHTSWATKNSPKVLLELFCVADNLQKMC